MARQFQLRDVINADVVRRIGESIQSVWHPFDQEAFEAAVLKDLDSLSFGDRSLLVARELYMQLPQDYATVIKVLIDSLGPELPYEELSGYDAFLYMPYCTYIARYGLDDFDESMRAMYEITKRFTSESPMRAFLRKYPEATLTRLKEWATDPNLHVRRLVSESTRPRLPLDMRLQQFIEEPLPVLELLELLRDDSELYVRRSVANNLNDISKDNPEIVLWTLRRWAKGGSPEMDWLIRHALRTLLKSGDKGALALLGYRGADVAVTGLSITPARITIGEKAELSFTIKNTVPGPQPLMVDFVIYFMKANGRLASKVFKLSKGRFNGGEERVFKKVITFAQLSTRKYYPGLHRLELQINGIRYGNLEFHLITVA